MVCRAGVMSHSGFNGRCDDAKAAGWRGCGENVAFNRPPRLETTTPDTHQRWMDSTGHRENIMSSEFAVVGYGWCVPMHAAHALQAMSAHSSCRCPACVASHAPERNFA